MTAEDQARLDAAKPKILAAWANREKDPYGVGEAARDIADEDLRHRCGYDSVTEMLQYQLGLSESDAEQILHAVAITRRFSRAFVEKSGWQEIDVLNDLVQLAVVVLDADPGETPIPVRNEKGRLVHKRFADCALAELQAARDAALEKRKPKPHPHPAEPVPAPAPDPTTPVAPVQAPWTLWGGLWFFAAAFAVRGMCIQVAVGLVGSVMLAAAFASLKLAGVRGVIADVAARWQSGEWPKKRVAVAVAALVVAAIGTRLWSPRTPVDDVTRSLESASQAMKEVAPPSPAMPAPAPAARAPEMPVPAPPPPPAARVEPVAPPAPAPAAAEGGVIAHPSTALGVNGERATTVPAAAHHPQRREAVAAEPPPAPAPAPVPPSTKPVPSPVEGLGVNGDRATTAPAPAPPSTPLGVNGVNGANRPQLPAVWPWPEPPPPQYSDDVEGYLQRGLNAVGIRPDPPPKPYKQFRDELYRAHPEKTPPGWVFGPEDAGR